MFQPLSLYSCAKKAIRKQYCTKFDVLEKILPACLFIELLHDFLHCDESLGLSDDDKDELYDIIRGIGFFQRLSPEIPSLKHVAAVFAFDQDSYEDYDYFPFTARDNHIRIKYYDEFHFDTKRHYNICGDCFIIKCYGFSDCSANIWECNKVAYSYVTTHEIVYDYDLFDSVVRNKNNWCRRCYKNPLFIILNPDDCYSDYECDTMYIDELDEIDASRDCIITHKHIKGKKNDNLYNLLYKDNVEKQLNEPF